MHTFTCVHDPIIVIVWSIIALDIFHIGEKLFQVYNRLLDDKV